MSDQQITCNECGDVFPFSAAEQAFYAEKGLASPPKRCKACRLARKASRGDSPGGGGGGGAGFGGNTGPKRRFTNDVNEYRSPMTSNDWAAPSAGARGPAARGPVRPARPPRASGQGAPQGSANGNGGNDYRSPAFPNTRPSAAGPPKARGPRPQRDARAPRPERAKFDITCGACGTQAQVPFKPLEGRDVFCATCYRARRTMRDPSVEEGVEPAETDVGIVE